MARFTRRSILSYGAAIIAGRAIGACGSSSDVSDGGSDAATGDAGDASATTDAASDASPQELFDLYISTTGKDTNAGTLAAPWAITSLQDTNGNNKLMVGKRVGLVAGVYDIGSLQSGSQPGDYQHPVLRVPSGTASQPTLVGSSDASGYSSPRVAVLRYGASSGVNPMIGQNPTDQGYWTLDGVEVDGNGYAGALIDLGYESGGGYTAAGNTPGVVIRNCHLHGITGSAIGDNEALIFCSGTSGALFTNNLFHDAHKPQQADHCHAYLEYGCQGTQFTYNTVYDCDTGIDAKAGNSGTVVAFNYFYDCPTAVVQGVDGAEGNPNAPGTPYVVHHNVIEGCGASHACDVNGAAKQPLQWFNNTIYMTKSGQVSPMDLRSDPQLIVAYNNIVVCTANGSGPYTGTVAVTKGGPAVLDYNDYDLAVETAGWGLSVSPSPVTYDTIAAWRTASSLDAHSIIGDPMFAGAIAAGNGPSQFELAASSPCRGAGRVGGVTNGAAVDIGAWDGTVTRIGCDFATYPVSA
jgi:hypothetical protein